MPIEILIPPEVGSPHPLGPGMIATWQFTGPLETGSQWQVDLKDVEGGHSVAQHFFPAILNQNSIRLGAKEDGGLLIAPNYTNAHGASSLLTVQLLNPQGTPADIGNRAVTMDAISGVPWLVQNVSEAPPVTGGFTEDDRVVAADTNAAVKVPFLGVGGIVGSVLDIGQMFTSPPVELLRRAESLVLEGRGELRYPSAGPEVQAYGALVGLDHLPPGIGFRDGYIREYEIRIAQITVWGRHGNNLVYLKNLDDLSNVGQYLLWGGPFPRLIGYDISPGVRLTWQWLILGLQP